MKQHFFKIDERLRRLSDSLQLDEAFCAIEAITEYNQQKMLAAFIEQGVSESHFVPSTGYGYGDRGRDALDRVFAQVVGAEDSLVRHSFVSGTHALSVALFGVLRPGDRVLSITGTPYDTIHSVFGIGAGKDASGSLREFGVHYQQTELDNDGRIDCAAVRKALREHPYRMVYIQRSRGYSLRPSLSIADIDQAIRTVRAVQPDAVVMVDNCYGEFVEDREPTQVDTDLMAGSLIKNPGGGIAPTGGYIAGRADLVEKCAFRLTTPGLGREIGATLGHTRDLFMGLFAAPHVTGEAVKTAVYCSALFEKMGYLVTPRPNERRTDIIQTVLLETPEALVAFCQGMQKGAPVDSFVCPEPWDMPGYDSQVIMAAGSFTLGASIELSADAPLREPYAAWMQGGLNFHSAKMGVLLAAQSMLKAGCLRLSASE